MPSSTEPRSGLKYGWSLGESGWSAEMNDNILRIGRFGLHLSAKDRDLTAPPGSPATGDTYIPAAPATGAWAGHENEATVWDGAAWIFSGPLRTGTLAHIEDEQKLSVFRAGAWSAGVAV
ncbi:MAG: DUF2793 domain-containing protein [Immundisolibacter sp.]|uniref:DUF2793 domain-containing protein n=1 Tax=Immundisolibacter sp. TaxID=1934948 RepID=UPI0019A0CCB5|nr:DUF2793 domain-containing protein [Immundisolibacter sp.]MBC7162688.1 DUF2793 domain-containing protein [Immundisolibacter sp.]